MRKILATIFMLALVVGATANAPVGRDSFILDSRYVLKLIPNNASSTMTVYLKNGMFRTFSFTWKNLSLFESTASSTFIATNS